MADKAEELAREIVRAVLTDCYGAAGNLNELDLPIIEEVAALLRPRLGERLTFAEFSRTNRKRCESPQGFNHKLSSWSTSDWFTAVVGELGEAANIAKKLNRVRDGIPGNKESAEVLRENLAHEIGDAFVYLDLLAQSLGFKISDAAVEVFNAKSAELGCSIRLPAPPVTTTASHPEGGETPQVNRPTDDKTPVGVGAPAICPSCGRSAVGTITATNFNGCIACGQSYGAVEGMSAEQFYMQYEAPGGRFRGAPLPENIFKFAESYAEYRLRSKNLA